jgi:putative acyl-CoA dehydrogenase
MNEFFQVGPTLRNQYADDRVLRSYLKRRLPPEMFAEIEPGLHSLGERAVTDIAAHGDRCEANPPRHVPYDPWGRRIDHIETDPSWKALDGISAEEGIVATGYERKHGALSRLHQFVRIHLYSPSSAIQTCPLAMTDGAARAIELYGDEALKKNAFARLTSRDPEFFWTSGQWMTERSGGSDVSGTATIARLENGQYRLYGTKWFTSATTSQMAMTLARIEGAPEGNRGLSLFYLELRDENGKLNNIRVHRLKDKLGTKALPTAELTLEGTPAVLVGDAGNGVRKISSLFNITRMYNAVCAVSGMRRSIALARDYSAKRKVFGKTLSEQPLHVETLADLQVEYEGAFHLTFRLIELLGKDECATASEAEAAVLRLLTPIAKLYTAKQVIAVTSEVLECFGGAGYCEDTGLPRLLRDAQTLSIWEGTTNVLSLDTLRAIQKENAFPPFLAEIRARLDAITLPELTASAARVREALGRIEAYLPTAMGEGMDFVEAGARGFAFSLARTYAASLLLEHAMWSAEHENDPRSVTVALRWCAKELAPLLQPNEAYRRGSRALALDEEAVKP